MTSQIKMLTIMAIVLGTLAFIIALQGAALFKVDDRARGVPRTPISDGVDKVRDGDVTCYIHNFHGISCLRDR